MKYREAVKAPILPLALIAILSMAFFGILLAISSPAGDNKAPAQVVKYIDFDGGYLMVLSDGSKLVRGYGADE